LYTKYFDIMRTFDILAYLAIDLLRTIDTLAY